MSVRLRAGVSSARVGDGMVLLDERSGGYHQLNRTAATILDAVLETGSVEQAAGRVRRRYAIDAERAARDARRVVAELRAAGLVVG